MADASHELRTPLTIMRANAEVLQWAEAGDPADRARALADLASEAERMSGLVDRLLTLERADAGQRLALCAVPLRLLLEEAYHQAQPHQRHEHPGPGQHLHRDPPHPSAALVCAARFLTSF